MRMIVAGGGTGGHLFPGLAVAESLTGAQDAVLFVGSTHGIEARVVPQTRFAFRALPIRGLRGRGWRGALQLAAQLPASLARAWRILGEFRAQVVLGVGGYASFPAVVAAWVRRVPVVLLEQNARPGLTNRILARLAQRVCTSFPEAGAFLPDPKVVLTGNPVRRFAVPPAERRAGFSLLVFGGSQGARRINRALAEAAPVLQAEIPDLRICHQTGAADAGELRECYRRAGVEAEVVPFIDDMGAAYADADLVVCRSGATTMAELTVLGKAAILVPYPHAADDHQTANARVLSDRGAAVRIADGELTGARLAEEVIGLSRDPARLAAMAEAAGRMGVPDAAARVVAVCRDIVGEGEAHV